MGYRGPVLPGRPGSDKRSLPKTRNAASPLLVHAKCNGKNCAAVVRRQLPLLLRKHFCAQEQARPEQNHGCLRMAINGCNRTGGRLYDFRSVTVYSASYASEGARLLI